MKTPDAAPAALALTAPKATRAALRKGLILTVTAPAAGTVKATLTLKGKKVASGMVKARKAGTVKLKLSKVTAAKARRLKGKALKLTVTAGTAKATRTLKVR